MPFSIRALSGSSSSLHNSNRSKNSTDANQRICNALDHTIRFIHTAHWLSTTGNSGAEYSLSDELNTPHERYRQKRFDKVRARVSSSPTRGFFKGDRERIDSVEIKKERARTLFRGYPEEILNDDEGSVTSSQNTRSTGSTLEKERLERYRILSEQYHSLDSECTPPLNHNKLIERQNCGLVFRKETRSPKIIFKYGFGPSREFGGPNPLLTSPNDRKPLIVSRTLRGAVEFEYNNPPPYYYIYAIYCEGIPGVQLMENVRFNNKNLNKFLRTDIKKDALPDEVCAAAGCFDEMHITSGIPPERIFLVETDDPKFKHQITQEEKEDRRLVNQLQELENSIDKKLDLLHELLKLQKDPRLFLKYQNLLENIKKGQEQAVVRDLEEIKGRIRENLR